MEICVKTYDRDSISKGTIEVDYLVIGGMSKQWQVKAKDELTSSVLYTIHYT